MTLEDPSIARSVCVRVVSELPDTKESPAKLVITECSLLVAFFRF